MSRIYIFLEYPTDIPHISHIYPTSWDVPQIYYLKGYPMSWDVPQIYYPKGYSSQGLAKGISQRYSISTRGMANKEFNISSHPTSWLGSL